MRLRVALALLAATALHACGSTSDPTDLTPVVEPITIDSVTVRVVQAPPVQVFAHVKGIVGDGCSTLLPLEQTREANVIQIAILRQRPRQAICTQIARLFDEEIPLAGSFPAGSYTLRVNETIVQFQVN